MQDMITVLIILSAIFMSSNPPVPRWKGRIPGLIADTLTVVMVVLMVVMFFAGVVLFGRNNDEDAILWMERVGPDGFLNWCCASYLVAEITIWLVKWRVLGLT